VSDPLFYNSLTGLPVEYQRAAETEMRRRAEMRRAYIAYAGHAPKALRAGSGETDDSVRLGWARLIVDKGVTWLFGKDLNFEMNFPGESDVEQWLNDAWPLDSRMTTLQKLATNGGISGHVYAKIIAADPYPRVVVLDPMTVTPSFNPDDFSEVVRYKIQYPAIEPGTGKPITFTQVHERNVRGTWTITDTTEGDKRTLTRREYEWPFAFPQIIECQNIPAANEYWGEADLNGEILDLVEKIEFVASNTSKMTRIYANPILWIAGLSAEQGQSVDLTPGGVLMLPEPDMRLNVADTKLDIKGSLELYTRFIDDLHSFSHIPKIATDATQGQQIGRASGSAMRYHYTPLVERTELKRRTYGAFVAELVKRLLVVGGRTEEVRVRLMWPEMIADPMADIERAKALVDLGLSKDTVWRTAGVSDPEAEAAKVEAERGTAAEQLAEEETTEPPMNTVPAGPGGPGAGNPNAS
jgi:hypothetical protein